MQKYEIKLRNIWKTFDPNKPDEELNEFIREYHPSVKMLKGMVYGEMDRLNQAIRLFKNAEYRKEFIEDTIYRDMVVTGWGDAVTDKTKYEKDVLDHKILLTKEFVENALCECMFLISFVESFNQKPKKIEDINSAFLKRQIEVEELDKDGIPIRKDIFVDAYDPRVLDKWWDGLWEYDYPVDNYWIPKVWVDKGNRFDEKLKDLIWNDWETDYGSTQLGLRNQLAKEFENLKSIIPDDLKEELQRREEKTKKKVKKYLLEEAKHPNGESSYNPPYIVHYSQYHEQTWDVEFITADFWEDMDFEEIYSRRKKEEDERDGVEIKELSIGTYDKFHHQKGRITLKPNVAARIEPYKTLEDLKNNHNLGGGVEPEEGWKEGDRQYGQKIDFIPEWSGGGHDEDLEDKLHRLGSLFSSKHRLNGDVYFHVRWANEGYVDVTNESEKELDNISLYQTNSDKHSYFHFSKKEREVKEIQDEDLPTFGCLNGQEEQVERAKALHKGLSEWEIRGTKWNEEKFKEWYSR